MTIFDISNSNYIKNNNFFHVFIKKKNNQQHLRNNLKYIQHKIKIFLILIYKILFFYFTIFFNLFVSNELIEDNKAILWLFDCDEIMGIVVVDVGGGGGGGGGLETKDDELTATM